jgi:hypothetical protein
MSVVAYFAYRFLTNYFGDKQFAVRLIEAFVPIILAGITFVIAAKILKIEQLEQVISVFRRKLGR